MEPTRKSVTVSDKLKKLSQKLENSVTREYMESLITKLKEELQTEIHRENGEFINSLKWRISTLETENEDLKERVSVLEQRETESEVLVSNLENQLNDLEQQGRKNSVRIAGLHDHSPKESVEDCVKKVVDFANSQLKVLLSPEDIDIAHRLGRFNPERKRPVIVKCTHGRKKHEIIRTRRTLKGSGFTVWEDLTKINQQKLSEAFRMECVQNSYSIDGKLFVVLKNGRRSRRRLFHDTRLTKQYLENDANFN
ncbi:uncharacterized protein LOC132565353 [Ylistrum balloti]|uniref:uncharacterized protein LOC132565353 n=1 Tax=Ylistrum balloti TaxID=509963 RepID=UPI0029059C9D|nr:uncharacterized protein LOC132565353 [Ylistrum balloti]